MGRQKKEAENGEQPVVKIRSKSLAGGGIGDVPAGDCRMSSQDDDTIQEIRLPRPDRRCLRCYVRGSVTLIVNKPRESTIEELDLKARGAAKLEKGARNVELEALESNHLCYGKYDLDHVDNNIYGFPSIGFKKGMAAAGFRQGGAKNKVNSFGSFFVHGPYNGNIPFLSRLPYPNETFSTDGVPEGVNPMHWHLRARYTIGKDPVVTQTNSLALAYRPKYEEWAMVLEIVYNENNISKDNVIHFLILCGESGGIGAWRNERGGEKGLFDVIKVEQLPRSYKPQRIMISCE